MCDWVFAGDGVVQIGPFWLSHGSSGQFYDLGPGSPRQVAAGPRSSMWPGLVLGPGSYPACHVTRSNSLPSGSANVVWRIAATPGGSAAGGSLIWLSGHAPPLTLG